MTKKQIIYTLPILVLLIGIVSPNQWSVFPIGNTTIIWGLSFGVIIVILWYKNKFFKPNNQRDYGIVSIYFVWMIAGSIRGMFVAEGYWEWKQLIAGVLALSLPVFVYVFSIPWILHNTLRLWFRFGLPLFFVFFIWALKPGAYQFYLGPVLLLSVFIPILRPKWKIILGVLLLLMVFATFGARSQVIKAIVSIMFAFGLLMRHHTSSGFWINLVKVGLWTFYLTPTILLAAGLSGTFNIFEDLSSNTGKYIEHKVVDGQVKEEDLAADSRTFIYEEVIRSAIVHGYIWLGRTPARGNDSAAFGDFTAEELNTGRYERHRNEVCFPNVFTWLGIVGMLLYCAIYIRASWLAVYRSRNIFIKIVGLFIAFQFMYGWIENTIGFNMMNIVIWMAIAMGLSCQFRMMNNRRFVAWLRTIFNIKYLAI